MAHVPWYEADLKLRDIVATSRPEPDARAAEPVVAAAFPTIVASARTDLTIHLTEADAARMAVMRTQALDGIRSAWADAARHVSPHAVGIDGGCGACDSYLDLHPDDESVMLGDYLGEW